VTRLGRHEQYLGIARILNDVMNDVSQKMRARQFPGLARGIGAQRERSFTRRYPERAGHKRKASAPRLQDVNKVNSLGQASAVRRFLRSLLLYLDPRREPNDATARGGELYPTLFLVNYHNSLILLILRRPATGPNESVSL
jgi:hypothetical protein